MNIKRISLSIVLFNLILLSACAGAQSTQVSSPTETESIEEEAPTIVEKDVDQAESSLVTDIPSPFFAQTTITSQNVHTLTEVNHFGKMVEDLAWSPTGNTLAYATAFHIYLYNTETCEEIDLCTNKYLPNGGHNISFSPNGDLLAVSYFSSSGGGVDIFDMGSQELLYTLDEFEGMGAFGTAFSADSTKIATAWGNPWGFGSGGVMIWDTVSGDRIFELGRENDATIYDLTFNHNGDLLAAVSGEGNIYLWDVETGQQLQVSEGIGGYGYAIAFSPDDSALAVGGAASSDDAIADLKLIELETGEVIFDLQGHEQAIRRIGFNTDGRMLVSASWDGTVRLWDTQTGQQLAVLDVPTASNASFNPDGTLLATSGYNDLLRLWGTEKTAANIANTQYLHKPLDAQEITQIAEDFKALTDANRKAHNAKDYDAIEALFTEDMLFDDYSFGDHLVGIKAFLSMTKMGLNLFPNFRWKTTNYFLGSDRIVTIASCWGANLAGNSNIEYTELDPFIHVFLYKPRGDRIASWRLFWGYDVLMDNNLLSETQAIEIKSLLSTYAAAWSSMDSNAVGEMYAEDAIRQDSIFKVTQQGKNAITSFAEAFFKQFPNTQWTPIEMFGETSITNEPQVIGSSYAIEIDDPSGEDCEVMALVLLQIMDGKIEQEVLFYEIDSLIQCGWAK